MKILHTADIHFDAANQEAPFKSLTIIAETAERERPDFVVIAGDLFNRSVPDTAAAGMPKLLKAFERIRLAAPIYGVSGTPTHDIPGCYAPLEAADFIELLTPECNNIIRGDCLVLGLPEPGKEWFLAGTNGISAEEANELIKNGLRGILLGLGAIRRQYPYLPCVFVYHGGITGAHMSKSQIATGGLNIGREDLELIGADYIALGHFHAAQKIDGLPAYYPGSARYGDNDEWNEDDQKGFNLVEIATVDVETEDTEFGKGGTVHEAKVTRIPFPHLPPRKKIVADWKDADEPLCTPIEGFQVWQVYRATKEERAEIDETEIAGNMLNFGALPGSRVTVEQIYEVKAGLPQIAELNTLREKIQLKAEADGKPVAETILQKADQLEHEAEERGELQRTSVIAKTLKLRGSKAVYKGRKLLRQLLDLPELPVDELALDFARLDPGVVAFIGDTGTGKTSVFKFLAPFTDMPGRRGPLRNHFRLRDSSWELTFLEEYSGAEFRVLCLIDGINKDGKCEYYLYRNGTPLTHGRLGEYDEAVKRYFGTPELFVRCTLVVQKPTKDNPDLSEATKGERQAVVRELAGLGYYQVYTENAKEKGDTIEAQISVERGRIQLIEQQLAALPELAKDRAQKAQDLATWQDGLRTLELRGLSLKSDVEQLAEKVAEQRSLTERIADLNDQVAQKQQVIHLAAESITEYQQAVEWRPMAEKVIKAWDELKEQENAENRRLSAINADNARLQGEYTTRLQAHNADVRKVEGLRADLKTKSASVAGARNVLQAQIDHLTSDLKDALAPFDGTCFNCGVLLDGDKLAAERKKYDTKATKRAETETKLADLKRKYTASGQEIAKIDTELSSITLPTDLPPFMPAPADQKQLRSILGALAVLKIVQARENVATAQEASTRLQETEKQKEQAKAALDVLQVSLAAAKTQLDATIQPAYDEAHRKYEAARTERGERQKAIAGLEARIHGLDERIAELQASEKDLGDRKVTLEEQQACAAEWRYLQEVCGPSGLQAEELKLIGPKIADTANGLLSSVFGSRFSIEYRLDRMAGRGKDLREVPDFSIWIIDNEDNGSEQEFMSLSGGESVPVKLAIHLAFVKIQKQRFSPMLIDEADGALSPRLRAGYVQMIEHARTVANLRNVMVVSHDEGVQEMIAQKILMSELARESQAKRAAA